MVESQVLHIRPEVVDWWLRLRELADTLGTIHRWTPAAHPPVHQRGYHQHACPTLVACLHGVVRVEHPADRIDITSGEALLIAPGTWHRHAPLRARSVSFAEGFIAGRSDFFFDSRDLHVVGSVPVQPQHHLMSAALAADDPATRRARTAELLASVSRETATPVSVPHPALLRMEIALWVHLHRRDTMARMLAASGLSRAQAYRLAREHWGSAPATLVRREKIRLAEELLRQGIAVAEVAERCGFASRRAFTRAMRSLTGAPPSAGAETSNQRAVSRTRRR